MANYKHAQKRYLIPWEFRPMARYLTEDNVVLKYLENGGSSNLAIDGTTPVTFKAVPAAGKFWVIARLVLYFSDFTAFAEEKFGGITALTNGVDVKWNNTIVANWKDNIDINTSMFDLVSRAIYTKEDKSGSGRWSFFKFGEVAGVKISDTTNGFSVTINDNLDGLTQFRIRIHGMEYDE